MDNRKMRILIRSDGGVGIGCGHVMRSLAIAEKWKKAGGDVFFISQCPERLKKRIEDSNIKFFEFEGNIGSYEDFLYLKKIAKMFSVDWMLFDGYHFLPSSDSSPNIKGEFDYISECKTEGYKVAVVDDLGIPQACAADVIINQNIYASFDMYPKCENSILLGGVRYFMLRDEFCEVIKSDLKKTGSPMKSILVTMGGADSKNMTAKIVDSFSSLKEYGKLNINVIIGPAYQYRENLEKLSSKSPHHVNIIFDTDTMAELIAASDVVITAAGITAYEVAFLLIPALHVIIADNQIPTAEFMDALGVSVNLGKCEELVASNFTMAIKTLIKNKDKYNFMRQRCKNLIDGKGVERIVKVLRNLPERRFVLSSENLLLREAEWSDVISVWKMANDPVVRKNSLSPEPIPLASHVNWFAKKLSDENSQIWIGEIFGHIVGQVRYDKTSETTAVIDIHTAPGCRAKGIGKQLLTQSLPLAFKRFNLDKIEAVILPENIPSIKLFLSVGFVFDSDDLVKGISVKKFILFKHML